MKVLVVATNTTPDDLSHRVAAGQHQRVDYFELADRFGEPYVDYNAVPQSDALRHLEQKLRMDMRLAQHVVQLVSREGYDVVLSLSERVGIPLAALLPRTVAHLVIMHHPMSPPKIKLIRAVGLAKRWRTIITLSNAESRGLEAALGLPAGSVMTLHTPVDVNFYRPLDDVPLDARNHIQSLGLSHRDYPTLLRAMRRLPHISCHLRVGSAWVSGKGGFENEQLPPNVVIQPFVQPHELRACYACSRFIVVPIRNSTQWSAGCTSVQAAQAMGRAVITTAMPGLSEYLIDGETGILVGVGDDQAMAEAIEYLWYNPDVAEHMGQRGREWLTARFSLDQWLKRVVGAVCAAGSAPELTSYDAPLATAGDSQGTPFNDSG